MKNYLGRGPKLAEQLQCKKLTTSLAVELPCAVQVTYPMLARDVQQSVENAKYWPFTITITFVCVNILLIQQRFQLVLAYNWRLQVEWKTHCPKVLIFTTLKCVVHGNHLIFQWLLKLWAIDEIGLGGYFGSCMVSQLFISFSFKIFGYKLAYETAWHAETAYLYCSLWVIDLLITKKA